MNSFFDSDTRRSIAAIAASIGVPLILVLPILMVGILSNLLAG